MNHNKPVAAPHETLVHDAYRDLWVRVADPPLSRLDAIQRVQADWKPKNFGLDNLGNTCYINAGLQCLLHTTEFTHHFLSGFYKEDLQGRNGKVAESFNLLVDQTHSHSATSNVPKDQFQRPVQAVSPHYVKRELESTSYRELFEGNQQQDSQESLNAILDCIHEDLNRVTKSSSLPHVFDGKNDTQHAQELQDRFKMRNNSIVTDTFFSQMRSQVKCTCGHESVSFDPSSSLMVSLPKAPNPLGPSGTPGTPLSPPNTSLRAVLDAYVIEVPLIDSVKRLVVSALS
jgi:ubiquitin C-terminal hydrolase